MGKKICLSLPSEAKNKSIFTSLYGQKNKSIFFSNQEQKINLSLSPSSSRKINLPLPFSRFLSKKEISLSLSMKKTVFSYIYLLARRSTYIKRRSTAIRP
jgi:hypothetical protein